MAEIPDLDGWLTDLMEGQPPIPKQYEFWCHPDVYLALREASDRQDWEAGLARAIRGQWGQPEPPLNPPLFGSAAITVVTHLGSGGWELLEDGEVIKSGRLGTREDL